MCHLFCGNLLNCNGKPPGQGCHLLGAIVTTNSPTQPWASRISRRGAETQRGWRKDRRLGVARTAFLAPHAPSSCLCAFVRTPKGSPRPALTRRPLSRARPAPCRSRSPRPDRRRTGRDQPGRLCRLRDRQGPRLAGGVADPGIDAAGAGAAGRYAGGLCRAQGVPPQDPQTAVFRAAVRHRRAAG